MRRNAIGFGCAHQFCPSRRIHVCYIFMCVMCMCCAHVCGVARSWHKFVRIVYICILIYMCTVQICDTTRVNVLHNSFLMCGVTVFLAVQNACMLHACVAACCSVSQFVAMCCSVLHCVAVYCSVLQCVAVRYFFMHSCGVSVVPRVAMCCSMVQYVAGKV